MSTDVTVTVHESTPRRGWPHAVAVVLTVLFVAYALDWLVGGWPVWFALFVAGGVLWSRHWKVCAERAAIAARADQQHRWVVAGDERGVYGPAGAALMREIRR
jgi:hypothetical protein